mmetsp:Transcript_7821/g.11252  ORF Transcript_7821/g.11252 Transcript_7821/m.11252 type:complete len:132 (-) Transcript_7821:26-421(-)
MLECQEGNSKGFVNFRSKSAGGSGGGPSRRTYSSKKFSSSATALLTQDEENKKNNVQAIVIPEHLRATAPDPLQHLSKKSSTTTSGGIQQQQQSSLELSQQAMKLKAEMDALKQQRAERLKALKERTNGKL